MVTEIEPKHPPADMAGLDGLIELLAAKREYYVAGAVMQEWVNPDGPVAATQLQALAARVKVLEAENERLREELTRFREAEILYYEMPGGIRFPVGKAVRGAEPFAHAEGTTYPVTATITMVERSDDD